MPSKADTLREMLVRAPSGWLASVYEDAADRAEIEGDEDSLLDAFAEWLSDEHTLDVREDGLIEFWTVTRAVRRLIDNLPVVVYHHTSDAILDAIREEGLVRRASASANPHLNSGAGVYVTTECSGPVVQGYRWNAVQRFGGDGVCLTVRTDLRLLERDPDDVDLSCGAHQFVLPYVPPTDIVEWGR